MKCYIKKINSIAYFDKNNGFQNHWVYKENAKLFDTIGEAKATIKVYKLKNVEVEKCLK